MKHLLLFALPFTLALNSTTLQADEDTNKHKKKKDDSSESRRSTQDTKMKDSTLTLIDQMFPGTKSRDNKDFYEKKTFNNKKLAEAIDQVKVPSKDKKENEKAVASAIGDLLNTLDKETFQASWKKLQAEVKKYNQPGKEITQEEALLKRLIVAFQNWGEEKEAIDKNDEMYPFYLAWMGEDGKGGERKASEEFKKNLLDIIEKGAKGTDADKAAAVKKLLGDPSKDANDPANKWALGKDALKHIPKGLEKDLPKVLAQKDLGGIVMKNPEGKAILVKLPPDANLANAFKAPELQKWTLVGPTDGQFPKDFAATFNWQDGKWTKEAPALPNAVSQTGNPLANPTAPKKPEAPKPKTPKDGASENDAGTPKADDKKEADSLKEKYDPKVAQGAIIDTCNKCHEAKKSYPNVFATKNALKAKIEVMINKDGDEGAKDELREFLKKL